MSLTQSWKPQSVEELALYWISCHAKARKSMSSIRRDLGMLRKYILPTFGPSVVGALDTAEIELWISDIKRYSNLAPKSCNDILGLLRKIYNDGIHWGFVDKNPIARIRKFVLPEQDFSFWKHEEVNQFLGYWKQKEVRPVSFFGVLIALHTGLRRGEILGLRWDAIDFDTGMISVKRSFCRIEKRNREQTKSKRIRRIPLSVSQPCR